MPAEVYVGYPPCVFQTGEDIDGWVVGELIARGGMSSVFRCHRADTPGRAGAIKVVPFIDEGPNRARFLREVELMRSLEHPAMVRVFASGEKRGLPYLVMELVEGDTLHEVRQRGPVAPEVVIELARALVDGLRYAHSKGVWHRDLKPSNIILDGDGSPRILDWGIALEEDATRVTRAGFAVGTPAYTPPEWLEEGDMDAARWDIYSLGVVLHELLLGEAAWDTESTPRDFIRALALRVKHLPLDPGPPTPAHLRELIRDMTAAKPQDRPAGMVAVLERLDPPPPPPRRELPPVAIWVASAAIRGLLAAALLLFRGGGPPATGEGIVRFNDAVKAATLVGPDGVTRGPGALPAGQHALTEVHFVSGEVIAPGWAVAVADGDEWVIHCNARFEQCRQPEPPAPTFEPAPSPPPPVEVEVDDDEEEIVPGSGTGSVRMRSKPEGAAVTVDGMELGVTPVDIEFPYGVYTATLERAGYAPVEVVLKVKAPITTKSVTLVAEDQH